MAMGLEPMWTDLSDMLATCTDDQLLKWKEVAENPKGDNFGFITSLRQLVVHMYNKRAKNIINELSIAVNDEINSRKEDINMDNKLEARVARLESLFLKNESKQVGTIYHVCNLDSLKHIRKTNTIESSGKWYNALHHGSEWISFTRDQYFIPTDGLYYLTSQNILFQIVVDGNKLSENYKVGPYNDWYFQDDDTPAYREMEEAVKGPIKNASKYIKEIRFDFCSECTSDKTLELVSDLNPSLVYFNFIRKRSNKVKSIIDEAGITNGMTRDEFLDAVEALGY